MRQLWSNKGRFWGWNPSWDMDRRLLPILICLAFFARSRVCPGGISFYASTAVGRSRDADGSLGAARTRELPTPSAQTVIGRSALPRPEAGIRVGGGVQAPPPVAGPGEEEADTRRAGSPLKFEVGYKMSKKIVRIRLEGTARRSSKSVMNRQRECLP